MTRSDGFTLVLMNGDLKNHELDKRSNKPCMPQGSDTRRRGRFKKEARRTCAYDEM